MLYDVVVTRPFDKVFTYSSTNEQLEIGQVASQVNVVLSAKEIIAEILEEYTAISKSMSKPKFTF